MDLSPCGYILDAITLWRSRSLTLLSTIVIIDTVYLFHCVWIWSIVYKKCYLIKMYFLLVPNLDVIKDSLSYDVFLTHFRNNFAVCVQWVICPILYCVLLVLFQLFQDSVECSVESQSESYIYCMILEIECFFFWFDD